MDKLTAYRILGLPDNAGPDDIKEAYATLSKKYHPEETPEEFQQIHEAYVTLTRRGRRNQGVVTDYTSHIEVTSASASSESNLVFHNTPQQEEVSRASTPETASNDLSFKKSIQHAQELEDDTRQEQHPKYDFESSINQAEKAAQEQELQLTMQLINELKMLLTPPACHQIKNFKTYFGRKEYEKFFYTEVFIHNLVQLLKQTDLKPEIYSYLIKVYRLKDKDPAKLIPVAQELYITINNSYSIKQDPVAARRQGAIGGGLGALALALLRYGPKLAKALLSLEGDLDTGLLGLIPIVVLVGGCALLYKLFCKKHSTYKAQKYVAISLMLFSIVTFIFNLWAPFYPNSDSDGPTTSICAVIIGFMWWIAMEVILLILKKKREK